MSIYGFEQYTGELTDYEREKLLPAVVSGMETKIGAGNAISSSEAIRKMKVAGYKIDAPRFRKILHVIRVSGLIKGIVGTSKGYYIANNPKEYGSYIKSITERCEHMISLRDALTNQYEEFKTKNL